MKKLLMSMFVIAFVIACGGGDTSNGDGNNPPSKSGNQNGAKNNTQNATNNNTQGGTNNEDKPCGQPVSDDGSAPEPLPVC